jgi:hypothetical protein
VAVQRPRQHTLPCSSDSLAGREHIEQSIQIGKTTKP